MAGKIDGAEIQSMVQHWLETPVGSYLGSDYGQDAKSMLQLPLADARADEFLRKMRQDVPILQVLPAGAVNLYSMTSPPDRLELVVEVAGRAIEVGR